MDYLRDLYELDLKLTKIKNHLVDQKRNDISSILFYRDVLDFQRSLQEEINAEVQEENK